MLILDTYFDLSIWQPLIIPTLLLLCRKFCSCSNIMHQSIVERIMPVYVYFCAEVARRVSFSKISAMNIFIIIIIMRMTAIDGIDMMMMMIMTTTTNDVCFRQNKNEPPAVDKMEHRNANERTNNITFFCRPCVLLLFAK